MVTLTQITQETREDWEKKEKEQQETIAKLKRELAKSKGKVEQKREKKVIAEYQTRDALNMLQRQVRSRLVSMIKSLVSNRCMGHMASLKNQRSLSLTLSRPKKTT